MHTSLGEGMSFGHTPHSEVPLILAPSPHQPAHKLPIQQLTSTRCATISRSSKPIVAPCQWPADPDFPWFHLKSTPNGGRGSGQEPQANAGGESGEGNGDAGALEVSSVQDSVLLMKFFQLSSAVASALCWCKDGSTLELLFKLNAEETRIVEFGRREAKSCNLRCLSSHHTRLLLVNEAGQSGHPSPS